MVSCIEHNLNLGFDEVVIFNDSVTPRFSGTRITNINALQRLTYRQYIDIVRDERNHGSLVVLTNTDIKLDPNIFLLCDVIDLGMMFCMSRYESNGSLAESPWCTQDVWAMLSQPVHNSIVYNSDIPIGTPGCELRFAEIVFNVGFKVFNPCSDVKNIHVHSAQAQHRNEVRNYGAYLFTPPCSLDDVRARNPKSFPFPCYLTSFSNRPLRIG
jgi:hypothetical protein